MLRMDVYVHIIIICMYYNRCGEIAVRCIELFVRHSALLRPISAGGRVRLQSDYMFLENALKVLCPHLSDLGRPYRYAFKLTSIN